jgi:hypothetical protein
MHAQQLRRCACLCVGAKLVQAVSQAAEIAWSRL